MLKDGSYTLRIKMGATGKPPCRKNSHCVKSMALPEDLGDADDKMTMGDLF